MSKLNAGQADITMVWLADSTFNAATEPVRLLDPEWAAAYPNYMVRNALYYDTTDIYGASAAGVTVNARLTNDIVGTALFTDTFDRADGDLGTASSGGQTWAANTWDIAGNSA